MKGGHWARSSRQRGNVALSPYHHHLLSVDLIMRRSADQFVYILVTYGSNCLSEVSAFRAADGTVACRMDLRISSKFQTFRGKTCIIVENYKLTESNNLKSGDIRRFHRYYVRSASGHY